MRKRVLRVGAIDLEACRIEPKRKKKKDGFYRIT